VPIPLYMKFGCRHRSGPEARNENVRARGAPPRRRRFTLLELLIAILMLAGLIAAVFMAAAGVTSSWERMTVESDRFAELLVLDRTLDSLLSNAVPFRWASENTDQPERPAFYGRPDQLGFTSIGQVHSTETGGIVFVHLQVVDENLVAYYQPRPLLHPEDPEMSANTSVLASGIRHMDCLYADSSAEGDIEWVDEWDHEEERLEIPLAVALRVFWLDGREEAWLRRTAGSGQFERYGQWKPGNNP